MRPCCFERAIFLSWYCSKGDCKFCYMSTQKSRIKDPKLAKRTTESVLAEVLFCRLCNWKIEFLSGGYESYSRAELISLMEKIHKIYKEKLWLNMGVLSEEELKAYSPYIVGVCGAVETINKKLHEELCPSKPINDIEDMFKMCSQLGLKKSITIIIGLGETIEDFPLLKGFIEKHGIDRITFYALNPHKGTMSTKKPDSDYYAKWITKTRSSNPSIEIIAGSWVNRLEEIHLLLEAGADSITKFPGIKLFNTKYSKRIEKEVKTAGRDFVSRMSSFADENPEKYLHEFDTEFRNKIMEKFREYEI